MKGFALLGLALALEAAFLFSVQLTPSRDEAAAQLWPSPRTAPASSADGALQEVEPRVVDVKDLIAVVLRGQPARLAGPGVRSDSRNVDTHRPPSAVPRDP
jgi:hypothetical protein